MKKPLRLAGTSKTNSTPLVRGARRRVSQSPTAMSSSVSGSTANGTKRDDNSQTVDAVAMLNALVALKNGNFSARLPLTWTGLPGKVADAFNEVAELMSHSTDQLNRVSRLVGKEGKIQERLPLGMVAGAWAAP